MMKILTVIGARPQFIKAAAVSHAFLLNPQITEVLVHTGQHFDENMSQIFFEQMQIPQPKYNLGVNGGSHASMTAQMMVELEKVMLLEQPDFVLVYGDTNSTLAAAITASKLHIKLIHVEAGLRSFNMAMPEEINRILTDQVSDFLFCPTETAIQNLQTEGLFQRAKHISNIGDVMYDALLFYKDKCVQPKAEIAEKFVLLTMHRAENTDSLVHLTQLVNAINQLSEQIQVVFPIHPRTVQTIKKHLLSFTPNVQLIEPVGYLEMLWLLQHCECVLTDSGGLQKEAYFSQKYCVTLRNETEWVELVDMGVNFLVGSNAELILEKVNAVLTDTIPTLAFKPVYGTGQAAIQISNVLMQYHHGN
ncbi:UDP-N-acetylglucosamine 2-epimerase (non-hydrolyzing) [Catenovulum sp. 2E275]|uniref:non-hydrolyzing UDP-N-acetylglucosamine 2-epimerase n=1 Tax=Catenovulum sp. 2E275 TaxID=2980497 RepID=UPI0021D3B7B9|nr:UDP-N-acetylglucosamine 2-epimerase (non-hydrolyzing) [Catenovulum sp. 2E275]MCU4674741.1 UDP-N-acetylglucosamine 2-epimerase (non-hydrolyzing) [Catenovulum sp. 2E275]